ncbi:hypothetical protein MANES_03G096616v8 [Manihot esculenta]|uniref:Uncharacterized protein n=1 Tax=Manihot esculenta TaxID=3983 RepID=A0ACB7HXX7_MANES|nr:hypothetical protein MANES_03G096616v8 [Manihot esculenta]
MTSKSCWPYVCVSIGACLLLSVVLSFLTFRWSSQGCSQCPSLFTSILRELLQSQDYAMLALLFEVVTECFDLNSSSSLWLV